MSKYTDNRSDGTKDLYEKAMDAYRKLLKLDKSDMWTWTETTEPMIFEIPTDLNEGDVYYVRLPGWKTLSCMMVEDLTNNTVLLSYVVWNETLNRFEYLQDSDHIRYKTVEVEFVEKVEK